jgi:hypothetical protein
MMGGTGPGVLDDFHIALSGQQQGGGAVAHGVPAKLGDLPANGGDRGGRRSHDRLARIDNCTPYGLFGISSVV